VGIVLWVVSGFAAFFLARIVPPRAQRGWLAELAASLLTAALLGVLATALDFGGWKELDWRAGLFTFFGAMTAIGIIRALRTAPRNR
jgi:uncharacterized membrane protein YeaQ/YmgE (transglycosylase-associated protein family)